MAKILIADDSSFMRRILTDILRKNGYENLLEAHNGKEAAASFASEKPDLVLTDIIMPEMDGIELLKQVIPQGARVIVISAVGQEEMIKQAMDAGARGYIIKPFDEKEVIAEVRKVLA